MFEFSEMFADFAQTKDKLTFMIAKLKNQRVSYNEFTDMLKQLDGDKTRSEAIKSCYRGVKEFDSYFDTILLTVQNKVLKNKLRIWHATK